MDTWLWLGMAYVKKKKKKKTYNRDPGLSVQCNVALSRSTLSLEKILDSSVYRLVQLRRERFQTL